MQRGERCFSDLRIDGIEEDSKEHVGGTKKSADVCQRIQLIVGQIDNLSTRKIHQSTKSLLDRMSSCPTRFDISDAPQLRVHARSHHDGP